MNKGKFVLSLLAIGIITVFGIFTMIVLPFRPVDRKETGSRVSTEMKIFSKDELASHAVKEDCYLLIHGYVYDVTGYAPLHPGGDVIFQGCGKDATDMFENRWMGSGTVHSEAARQLLVKYKIGTVESTQ